MFTIPVPSNLWTIHGPWHDSTKDRYQSDTIMSRSGPMVWTGGDLERSISNTNWDKKFSIVSFVSLNNGSHLSHFVWSLVGGRVPPGRDGTSMFTPWLGDRHEDSFPERSREGEPSDPVRFSRRYGLESGPLRNPYFRSFRLPHPPYGPIRRLVDTLESVRRGKRKGSEVGRLKGSDPLTYTYVKLFIFYD